MPEDSSLTEYIETAEDQSTASTEDDTEGQSPDVNDDTVTVTFTWSDGGGPCADCGGTVVRRWTDDGRLVCGDCKGW